MFTTSIVGDQPTIADMQVVNKIMYSCSSDHTARAWLKDVGELLQVYKGNSMPIGRVVYHKGVGQYGSSLHSSFLFFINNTNNSIS